MLLFHLLIHAETITNLLIRPQYSLGLLSGMWIKWWKTSISVENMCITRWKPVKCLWNTRSQHGMCCGKTSLCECNALRRFALRRDPPVDIPMDKLWI